jgi:putative ABC transport system permease protein
MLVRLAWFSLWHRRGALALLVIAMALSIALLFFIERLRSDIRTSFAQSISGTDLVVGPRGHPGQLLLSTVFHLGEPRSALGIETLGWLQQQQAVAWTVPISLGDSHRGFRVVGTQAEYFARIRTGEMQSLSFARGRAFSDLWDVVLGAQVARRLGYSLGTSIVLDHGFEAIPVPSRSPPAAIPRSQSDPPAPTLLKNPALPTPGSGHDDKPFRVVGILSPTGTAIDRSLFVSLEAIEAMHIDWQAGAPIPGLRVAPELVRKFDLSPKQLSAVLVGLKSRALLFRTQRSVETQAPEPLTAAAPGVALDDLWKLLGMGEASLGLLASVTIVVAMLGLGASLLGSMRERERELAILRVVGARPWQLAWLVVVESLIATSLALALALAGLSLLLLVFRDPLLLSAGVSMSAQLMRPSETWILAGVYACAPCASLIPALRAYRSAMHQSLLVR